LYRKKATIPSGASSAVLTNFPVLYSVSLGELAHTSSGGGVEHSSGYDIIFTGGDGTNRWDHEIERWTSGSGELVAWVRVPVLTNTVDTDFYVYYGNPDIMTEQGIASNVWDENYVLVLHMNETPDVDGNAADSSDYANDGTWETKLTSADQQAGKVGGSIFFGDYTNEWIELPNATELQNIDQVTISAWIRPLGQIGGIAIRCIYNKFDWFDVDYASYERLGYFSRWTSNGDWHTALNSITTGAWQHVAMEYDDGGVGYQPSFYIDGQSKTAGGTQPTGTHQVDTSYTPSVGGDKQNNRWAFHGRIDEFRISDIFRGPDWLATCHSNQVSPSTFVTLGSTESGAGWLSGYGYRRLLTITNAYVSATLTNFPVLVTEDETYIAHTTVGGQVGNANGYDIVFTGLDGVDRWDHELEKYDANGALVAWVRAPRVYGNTPTKFYMYWGNAGVSTLQSDPTDVWDSDYVGVWHMHNSPDDAEPAMRDSTIYANHGTCSVSLTVANLATGMVDGASHNTTQDDRINCGSSTALDDISNLTFSAWIRPDTSWSSENKVFWKYQKQMWVASNTRLHFGQQWSLLTGQWESPDSSIQTAVWQHVVVTYDHASTANDPMFFVNASSQTVTQTQGPSGTRTGDGATDFYIGSKATTSTENFNGILDEVRVSRVIRSPAWFAACYSNQLAPDVFVQMGAAQGTWLEGYEYRRSITVPADQVATELTNFPVLIKSAGTVAANDLKSRSQGGRVYSASGHDIVFKPATATNLWPHELESYDGATGALVAWVRVPILSASQNTTFHMYMGNPDVTSPATTATDVWDAGYVGVWHLSETPTGAAGEIKDSTANGYDGQTWGSMDSSNQLPGQIDGALDFDGDNDMVNVGDGGRRDINGEFTLSIWAKRHEIGDFDDDIFEKGSAGVIWWSFNWDHLRVAISNGVSKYYTTADYEFTAADTNSWFHLAFTHTNGTQKIFMNGAEQSLSQGGSYSINPTVNNNPWHIGGYRYANVHYDEARMSDVVRTPDWIQTCYSNQLDAANWLSWGSGEGLPASSLGTVILIK